jgi:hypothetical protein
MDPMKILRIVSIVLTFLLLGAHFSRAGTDLVAVLCLVFPFLLLVRKPWSAWALRVALLLGGVEWLRTLARLVSERRSAGEDWVRLALILGAVTLVTFAAAKAVRVPRRTVEPDTDLG